MQIMQGVQRAGRAGCAGRAGGGRVEGHARRVGCAGHVGYVGCAGCAQGMVHTALRRAEHGQDEAQGVGVKMRRRGRGQLVGSTLCNATVAQRPAPKIGRVSCSDRGGVPV